MTRVRATCWSGALTALLAAAPGPALAEEPAPGARAEADVPAAPASSAVRDRLLAEGQKLLIEGQIDAACLKLRASVVAQADAETLTASGQCHELQGKTATAWSEYTEATLAAARDGQRDREDRARSLAGQLAPRLSKLRIDVQAPREGQTVQRDGALVPASAWGALLPVDPGPHTITSVAPGMAALSIVVKIGGASDVRIVLVPPLAPPGTEPPAAPAEPPPAGTEPGVIRRANPIGVAAFVTTSFGLLGLTLGTVFGVMALNEAGGAEEDPLLCPDKVCSPAGIAVIDEARTKGVVSTVCFSVGGASLATGIVLFLVQEFAGLGPDEPKKPGAPSVTPVVGFGHVGVDVRF